MLLKQLRCFDVLIWNIRSALDIMATGGCLPEEVPGPPVFRKTKPDALRKVDHVHKLEK